MKGKTMDENECVLWDLDEEQLKYVNGACEQCEAKKEKLADLHTQIKTTKDNYQAAGSYGSGLNMDIYHKQYQNLASQYNTVSSELQGLQKKHQDDLKRISESSLGKK